MTGVSARGSLRVLLVAAAGSTTGGGERHVADLLHVLPERGFEMALLCPPEGDLFAAGREVAVPVFTAPIAAGLTAQGMRAVRAALSSWAPDVVHAHGARAAAFARACDLHARHRVVYHVHGIHADRAGAAGRRTAVLTAERLLRARTAAFVTVCHADAVRGARVGVLSAPRTVTVYNGIPAPPPTPGGRFRAELGLAAETPLVLSVGRFHRQKGQAVLLQAWRRIAQERPDACLALVGAGALENSLRQQAEAAGITSGVRFVAPRAQLDEAYADADVFALSSHWEGLPYVVLEAMAHEVAVAATAVDGVPEAVRDDATGVLVPPADPAALASALLGLLDDPARRRRLGAAAREHVLDTFTVPRMADGIAAVYRDVATRRT